MKRFVVTTEADRATISFDDGRMNLLSAGALEELGAAVADLPAGTRTLLFRSRREGLFAAGADMEAVRRFGAAEASAFSELGQKTFAAIASLRCATAVYVKGDCFGGALDLCLAFDLRIASSKSRFAHPGGRIGIVTGFAGTTRLPRIVSRRSAARMLLENGVLSAQQALDDQLIDMITDDAGELESLLGRLGSIDQSTLEVARLLCQTGVTDPLALHLLARRTAQLHSA